MDCSCFWTRRPDSAAGLQCAARVPAHTRGRRGQPEGLRPGARPAFPRAQALGRDALLRPRRAAAPDPRARPLRRSVRFVDRGRARLGDRRAASVLRRVLRREGSDEENEALLERVNATVRCTSRDPVERPLRPRLAVGNAHDRKDARHGSSCGGERRDRHDDRLPHAGEPFRIVKDGIGRSTERRSSRSAATRWSIWTTSAACSSASHGARRHVRMLPHRPEDEGADLGVLFFHNAGYSTACGHGTIALATAAIETMIAGRAGDDAHPRRAVRAPSGCRHGEGRQGRARSFYQRAVVRVRAGLGGRDVPRKGSRRHLVRRRVLRVCPSGVRGAQGRAGQRHGVHRARA